MKKGQKKYGINPVTMFGVILLIIWSSSLSYAQGRTGTISEADEALGKANSLQKEGNFADAATLYQKAIRLDPNLEEAYLGLSMILFLQGQYHRGETLTKEGLKQLPNSNNIKAQLGMHLFKLQRFQEAYQYLKQSIKSQAHRFDIQAAIGQCCMRLEDYVCASQAIQNYLSARPASLAKQDSSFQILLATAFLKRKDYVHAKDLFESVIRVNPKSVSARIGLAEVLLHKGDCFRAVAVYEKLMQELKPNEASDLRLFFGQAYLCSRQPRAALKQAELFLKDHPKQMEGLMLRGDAAFEMKMYSLALNNYKQVLVLTHGAPYAQHRIIRVLFYQKEYAKVLAQTAEELKKPDVSSDILVLTIRAAIWTKKIPIALNSAQRLIEKGGTPNELFYAGMAHSSAGDFEQAISIYEKVLAQSRQQHQGAQREMIRALCYLARATFKSENFDATIKYLERARSLEPHSLVVNRNLALTYLKWGNNAKALQHLQVILKKAPSDFVANRMACRALLGMKKYREALSFIDRAISTVIRQGGIPLASALAESSVVRDYLGMIDRSAIEMERALAIAERDGSLPALVAGIKQNFARVYAMKANESLSKDQAKVAWIEIHRSLGESTFLSDQEQTQIKTFGALVALSIGKIAEGKEIAIKLKGKLNNVLLPPFNKLGDGFLMALLESRSPEFSKKLQGIARLEKMASQIPPPTKDNLLEIVRSGFEQAAVQAFNTGRMQVAKGLLAKATRLSKKQLAPGQRHNQAVISYFSGMKNQAITSLEAVKDKIPMALCNLAVHYDLIGETRTSFNLFRQCEQRGAPFPGLKDIIASKKRVFGEIQK